MDISIGNTKRYQLSYRPLENNTLYYDFKKSTSKHFKGPAIHSSDEAKILAYRKAIEFVMDAGLLELVIDGDNANAIRAIYL